MDAPKWVFDLAAPNTDTTKKAKKIPKIIPDGEKHSTCVSLAGSMRRRGCTAEVILAALLKLQFETPVPPKNLRAIAEDIEGRYPPESTDGGRAASAQTPDLLAGIHRDHGNSQRLIALYDGELRYCHAFKKWLWFDGKRWRVDEAGHSRELAKLTMIEFLRQAVEARSEAAQKFAKESLDSKRITNMLLEAQSGLAISPADLDTHPYLLNFRNGTLDLQTGELRPHRKEDFITKLVHYEYQPGARCERFMSFLEEITGCGPDASEGELERSRALIEYLRRAFGYSLTGATVEKAVFLLYGPRDNGKSTLLATFFTLLEEYSVLLQIDSLMVRQESNNSQADLAGLRGARFVMTSETEEGQRLAEGKLKRITQGIGRIKATRKYENPIEFDETHKLWIDANYLPVLRGGDQAIRRRLHAIPFSVVIPEDRQDRKLGVKLLSEGTGILAWAVRGAVDWCEKGLRKPDVVRKTTDEWMDEADQIGRFLAECCVQMPNIRTNARMLYAAYKTWAEGVGERMNTEMAFCKRMKDLGLQSEHTRLGAIYSGVGLREV